MTKGLIGPIYSSNVGLLGNSPIPLLIKSETAKWVVKGSWSYICKYQMSVNERRSVLSLPPSFLVRWFHLRSKGSRVTAWPHQIRPNWERCLAQQKGNNLKSIKCKWNCHLPTSKNTWPKERNSRLKLQPHHLLSAGLRSLLGSCLPIPQRARGHLHFNIPFWDFLSWRIWQWTLGARRVRFKHD